MFRDDIFVASLIRHIIAYANEANFVTHKDSPKQLISLSVVQCNPETASMIRKVNLHDMVIPAYSFAILNPLFQKKEVSVVLELLRKNNEGEGTVLVRCWKRIQRPLLAARLLIPDYIPHESRGTFRFTSRDDGADCTSFRRLDVSDNWIPWRRCQCSFPFEQNRQTKILAPRCNIFNGIRGPPFV